MSSAMMATEHLGSARTLRLFCAVGAEVVYSASPTQTARTGRVWGRPLVCSVVIR